MRVELAFPPADLSPNARKDRRGLTSLRSAYKSDSYYLTKVAARGWKAPAENVPLAITFVQPDMRHRDVDNMLASCKAALDGFALALGVDDRVFRPLTINWTRGKAPGAVILEF